MADVQIDNGDFTRIANEILEHIAQAKLNGTQYAVVLTIWRFTYGYRRTSHEMSLGFIENATGINKKQVGRELAKLVERKIVVVEKEASFNKPQVLKFNKDYDQWVSAKTLTGSEIVVETVSGLVDPPVSELADQERKIKENIKDIVPYKEIIGHLNQVCNKNFKHTTEITQKHIHARWEEGHRIEQFKTVIENKAMAWLGTDMEKFLRPETLFGTKFEGYFNEKPKPPPKNKRVLIL